MTELIEKISKLDGVDINEGLRRMMGKESLYERCLKLFYKQAKDCEGRLGEYIGQGDYKAAFEIAHNMKGVTGNLSLTRLFEGYDEIVRRIRGNEYEGIEAIIVDIEKEQNMICSIIESMQ